MVPVKIKVIDLLQMSWRGGNSALETLVALRAIARQKAEADLRDLYREREVQRARAAERDPAALLRFGRPHPS
jgi:hypothetical protein